MACQRIERHRDRVRPASRIETRPQRIEFCAERQRVAAPRTLVKHRCRQTRRTGHAAAIRRKTGGHQQRHLNQRCFLSLGQHHAQPVGECRPLERRQLRLRLQCRKRHSRAVHAVGRRAIIGERLDGEHERAIRQPSARGVAHRRGRRVKRFAQHRLVIRRIAGQHSVARQHIRFAAEPAHPLAAAHEIRLEAGFDPLQFVLFRSLFKQARHLFVDGLFNRIHRHAGTDGGDDHELTRDLIQARPSVHIRRQLLVVNQTTVEARCLAFRQNARRHAEQIAFGRAVRRNVPNLVEPCLRYAILRGHALRTAPLRDIRLVALHRRPRRNVAERASCQFHCLMRINIARNHQHRIGGTVELFEPRMRIFKRGGFQILFGTDHLPRIRVAGGPGVLCDQPPSDAVRLVVALAFLIQHHAALLVQPLLRQCAEQVAHAVRLHPEREGQRIARHLLKVVGSILPCGAVHAGGTDPLHRLEPIVVEVLAAVEHQMFEEVGEAGASGTFVLGTHMVPDIHGHDRRLVIFMYDDSQTVFQNG